VHDADDAGAQFVAVVSESMARVLWPGQDPLGQCFRVRRANDPCRVVVGVAEDVTRSSLTDETPYQYYLPWKQYTGAGSGIFLRVDGDPAERAPAIQRALQANVPARALVLVDPLQDRIDIQLRSWRLGATMFTVFGFVALALTAFGLFSVISYGVAQRRHEFGVRLTLGASPSEVHGLILRQGAGDAAIGIAAGIALTFASTARLRPLLFHVSPRDPAVYVLVTVALLLVAVAACALPARRAARTEIASIFRADQD
jgi:ABC-type antimicrobial peptide transport system permease subunit